ncbi:MAG: hypothetical protein R3233_07775, partial [Xanthomonadales bacterium]|nr:hypothetical protein [Xanthomonadales bacterium]
EHLEQARPAALGLVLGHGVNLTEKAEVLPRGQGEELTGYKRPKHIEFRDDLPKSNVGKILRRELHDEELKKLAG